MIRKITLLSFVLLITINSFGQRLKYRNLKNDFSTKNYSYVIEDQKYSPLLAGVCNYILPSSGYFYVGEPLRGVLVFSSEMVTFTVFLNGLLMSMGDDPQTGARALMYSGLIATSAIQVWSIFNVVKIAQIKNLAYQNNPLTLKLEPDLNFMSQLNNNSITYGLRLSLNF